MQATDATCLTIDSEVDAAASRGSKAAAGGTLGRGLRRSKAPARHREWAELTGKRRRRAGPTKAPAVAAVGSPRAAAAGPDPTDADGSTGTTATIVALVETVAAAAGAMSPQSLPEAAAPPVKRARCRKRQPTRAAE